jgi:hypothetical protein
VKATLSHPITSDNRRFKEALQMSGNRCVNQARGLPEVTLALEQYFGTTGIHRFHISPLGIDKVTDKEIRSRTPRKMECCDRYDARQTAEFAGGPMVELFSCGRANGPRPLLGGLPCIERMESGPCRLRSDIRGFGIRRDADSAEQSKNKARLRRKVSLLSSRTAFFFVS